MAIRYGFTAVVVCKVVHRHVLNKLFDRHLNDAWCLIGIVSRISSRKVKRVVEASLQFAYILAFSQFLVEEDGKGDLAICCVLDVIDLKLGIE